MRVCALRITSSIVSLALPASLFTPLSSPPSPSASIMYRIKRMTRSWLAIPLSNYSRNSAHEERRWEGETIARNLAKFTLFSNCARKQSLHSARLVSFFVQLPPPALPLSLSLFLSSFSNVFSTFDVVCYRHNSADLQFPQRVPGRELLIFARATERGSRHLEVFRDSFQDSQSIIIN